MNASDRTPADLLRSALAADPARPLVTYYDDATGERVELSVATFANWVAKTANLLQDGLCAEPGERVALLLPAHWQTAVWLLACASAGVVADLGATRPARTTWWPARTGSTRAWPAPAPASPCRSPRWGGASRTAGRLPGLRGRGAGPGRPVHPVRPRRPGLPALAVDDRAGGRLELTGAALVDRARADAARRGLGPGSRLLSGLAWDRWDGVSAGLYAPLAAGGSVVLCRHPDRLVPEALAARIESERVTARADTA